MSSINEHQKRYLVFLPNLFTGLNMACGFSAIMLSYGGEFYQACMLLVLGALFDSVDGRLARMTGTESDFGEQFDSMSDLISFGMAPALLYYQRFLAHDGRFGMVGGFIFVLCGAMRLARFNANLDKVPSDYFQGLPIPLAAMSLIGPILFSLSFPNILELRPWWLLHILFYSLLMVSSIPFPSFKKSEWVKNHPKRVLLIIFLILASIVLGEEYMIGVYLFLYVFISFFYFVLNYKKMKNTFVITP